jgi:hypothetical protein
MKTPTSSWWLLLSVDHPVAPAPGVGRVAAIDRPRPALAGLRTSIELSRRYDGKTIAPA